MAPYGGAGRCLSSAGLLVVDEVSEDAVELVGVFDLGPVPASAQEQEPRVRDGCDEPQAVLVVQHAIVSAVDGRSRSGDIGNTRTELEEFTERRHSGIREHGKEAVEVITVGDGRLVAQLG